MDTINERLQDELFGFSVQLDRAKATQTQQVLGFLDELAKDLRQGILDGDASSLASGKSFDKRLTERERTRQEALIRQGQSTIERWYNKIKDHSKDQLQVIASMSAKQATSILKGTVFSANLVEPTLTKADLNALVDANLLEGKPAAEWWADQDVKTRDSFARQMRMGIASGESLDKIVTRIVGTRTGRTVNLIKDGRIVKVPQYEGGVMQISRKDAAMLVRTSAQSVANAALLETYQENSDILRGMQAVATLDSRTTILCISRDGSSWDLRGNPLPESPRQEPFPGPPPWHMGCRSTLVPITKSWEDLRADAGLPASKRKAVRTVPDSERASIDGRVPGSSTFGDWLSSKSVTYQKQVLGPGRQKLFSEGKITLAQLTDFSGNPLTLEELEQLAQ